GTRAVPGPVPCRRRCPLPCRCPAGAAFDSGTGEPVPRAELLSGVAGTRAFCCCLLSDTGIDREVLPAGALLVPGHAVANPGSRTQSGSGGSVGYTRRCLTDATAELSVALLLSACRRLPEAAEQPEWMCGYGLSDSTVGIIGLGRIGRCRLGSRLCPGGQGGLQLPPELSEGRWWLQHGFCVFLLSVPLTRLAEESDFVVVTCALTPATQGMCNKDFFGRMKKTSVFVNTSRYWQCSGAVVNQQDLYDALAQGRIARRLGRDHAEPLPPDPLLSLKNCVILPHIGSATYATRSAMAVLAATNLLAGLRGEPMPHELKL
uniref:Glyoxylate and hydroxypyruvate reductase n=1 Tax=Malurus cyaneus samueli TaxID=2593467 RepID=A0A8C5TSM1_9PASS